jgi:Arc/MetJ-type ribon-helix-helix transcriptional regulator
MPQIAIRVSEEELALLDRLVAEEHFASRAAVIRDALARLRKERDDREMAEELRRAYERVPETQEDRDWAVAGALLLAESTKDEPPWDFGDDEEADVPSIQQVEAVTQDLLGMVHKIAERERHTP